MANCMMFPKDWHDFIKDYSFVDSEHVYTNGSELIQVLRVTQLIEHLLKEQETVEPKTGHWIYKKYDDMFMCSCCERYSIRNNYPYCHWCGAKMEGTSISCSDPLIKMIKDVRELLKEQEAEWLEVDDKHDAFDCSNCGAMAGRKCLYCPGCGAKMKNGTRATKGR